MTKLRYGQLAGMNQHYRRYRFEEYLDSMERCGIQNLELWCGAPHFMLDPYHFADPEPLRRMAAARGQKFVALTAPSMQWQYQPAVAGRERQRLATAYYQNGVRVAAALGCPLMSINSGWGYWNEPKNEGLKRALEVIAQVADLAQQNGVTLALETLQPMESNLAVSLEEAKYCLRQLGHPAVKAMADIVAVGVAGETVTQWFEAFGKDLVHCHLVDGAPSGHLVFGDGEYPLEKILAAFERYDYRGFLTMELSDLYADDPFAADRRNSGAASLFGKMK